MGKLYEIYNTNHYGSSSLKALYRFESGALTTDSSGNGYTLTNLNTTTETTGKFGGGANFGNDTTDRELYINDNLGIAGNSSMTISVWVKLNAEPSTGIYYSIIQHNTTSGADRYLALVYYEAAGSHNLYTDSSGGTTALYNVNLGTTVWHHIVAVRDLTNSKSILYLDGYQVATGTLGTTTSSLNKMRIGGYSGGYSKTNQDDVGVWNRALSASEVLELYQGRQYEIQPTQYANCQALYHLENVNDSSGNSYTLTNNNAVTFTSAKFTNGANLGASNTNKRLNIQNGLGITNTFTANMWVKLLAEIGSNGWVFIYAENSVNKSYLEIYYDYNSGTRQLVFILNKVNSTNVVLTYPITLGTTKWYNIGATWDNTTFKVYLNGGMIGSGAITGTGTGTGANEFFLGSVGTSFCSSILIDETTMHSSARTNSQIAKLNAFQTGKLM